MNSLTLSLLLGATACVTFNATADTEETISKELAAQPGGTLVVNVEFGTVEIKPGSDSKASIDVWRKVQRGSKKDQESFLQARPVEITLDDGTISIKSHAKSRNKWWDRSRVNAQAKYTISVPAQFGVKVNTAGGSISVERLEGKIETRTAGGGLKFQQITGDITGSTAGGSIQAAQTAGALSLRTSGGSIKVEKGRGSLECSTSGGSIGVEEFRGSIKAKTTGGSLTLENVEGDLNGEATGGSITATLVKTAKPSPITLSATAGGIGLTVPGELAVNLDAEATGGGVHTDIPVTVTGKLERNRIKGTVNGGGNPLVLRAVGGSVKIGRL